MPKPRPVDVHVNSTGNKQYKLQELIHSRESYVFVPISGKKKTDLYSKGILDGRKEPIRLEPTYDLCSETVEVLAFSATEFAGKISASHLTGVVPLDKTFLISTREADRFIFAVCEGCDFYGEPNCFQKEFRCAEEDREKYRDSTWFELKKEARKERKRPAFPVKG